MEHWIFLHLNYMDVTVVLFTCRSVSSLLTFSVLLGFVLTDGRPEEAHRNPRARLLHSLSKLYPASCIAIRLEGGTHVFEEQSNFLQRLGQ